MITPCHTNNTVPFKNGTIGLVKIQLQQQRDRHRLSLHTQTNSNSHSNVVSGSIVETFFFLAAAIFQVS
jgi:hypothetical protein